MGTEELTEVTSSVYLLIDKYREKGAGQELDKKNSYYVEVIIIMKYMLRVEMKRAFCNRLFYIVVVICCSFAILDFFNTSSAYIAEKWSGYVNGTVELYDNDYTSYTDTALRIWMPNRGKAGKFYYLLITIMPLLAVIPYGASYVNDIKSGLINQFIGRTKKKHYYIAKLVTAFVSGGTVAVIPLIFNLIWCMCCIPWGKPIYASHLYPVGNKAVLSTLYYEHPALYVIVYLLYTFLVFGLLNCLCLSFTYIDDNVFIVLLIPFIFYYVTNVVISYGFGSSKYSIMFNANMIYLYKEVLPAVLCQLLALAAVNLLFLFKIKKDVV